MNDSRDTRPILITEQERTTTVTRPTITRDLPSDWEVNSAPAVTPPGLAWAVEQHLDTPPRAYFSALAPDSILHTDQVVNRFPHNAPAVIYRDHARTRWSAEMFDPQNKNDTIEDWWLNTAASRGTVLLPELGSAVIPLFDLNLQCWQVDDWGPKTANTLNRIWNSTNPSILEPIGLYTRLTETVGDARPALVTVALASDGTITHALIAQAAQHGSGITSQDVHSAWSDTLLALGTSIKYLSTTRE